MIADIEETILLIGPLILLSGAVIVAAIACLVIVGSIAASILNP